MSSAASTSRHIGPLPSPERESPRVAAAEPAHEEPRDRAARRRLHACCCRAPLLVSGTDAR